MRTFFIVAAAVVFVDYLKGSYRHWRTLFHRVAEKNLGRKLDDDEAYLMKHPNVSGLAIIPILGFLVILGGFLWAILAP